LSEGAVSGLMSGRVSLKRTVNAESSAQARLLTLLGLYPFDTHNVAAHAFQRIVSQPSDYRSEMMHALEMFWQVGFNETWSDLEPQMMTSARAMRRAIPRSGFTVFAAEQKLPAAITAGTTLAVHLMPSAFNVAHLWTAYRDSHERTTFYIPLYQNHLSVTERRSARVPLDIKPEVTDPALVFKALGDTTRYAIATTLARSPMTSVELARVFKVSKPTISHHVAQLRAAKLLLEEQTDDGIVLSLNRRVLETRARECIRCRRA
jgi:ArsR family transcriptional regulator, arsenate/arsenite/antimonite-responsive transcriptional repressor